LARGENRRVLIVVHRTELITQTVNQLRDEGITSIRILGGGKDEGPADAKIIVASVQTLVARNGMPLGITLLILDEAHHYNPIASEWISVARHYRDRVMIVGATATPTEALGTIFSELVMMASVRELMDSGTLVECHVITPGRYIASGIVSTPLAAYKQHTPNGHAVIFCASVQRAHDVATEFNAAGISAGSIDGETADDTRSEILARFASGDIRVVTNYAVLTEGWDAPIADVCITERGCSSEGAMLQMVGRVLRRHPAKTHATWLDLRGIAHRFGLPDDDRIYSLSDEPIKLVERLPALTQCKACFATFRWRPVCPRCGARGASPPPPRQVAGKLARYIRRGITPPFSARKQFARGALLEAWTKGIAGREAYAYAAGRFKRAFGFWPTKEELAR
jgi:superfamily II DNA or RNA helicase